MRIVKDRQGFQQTEFFLPRTKSAPNGESISWAKQTGDTDPEEALKNHLRINEPLPTGPLFAYRWKGSYRPLTKTAFLKCIKQAAAGAGLEILQGHGIRIGSTLEYLLRGTPFDVVKVKGRWASDAFTLYLRKHVQILAPYMQAAPEVQENFIRIAMPPVR